MKNLMIYLNPDKIDLDSEKCIKVQIDNSLAYGWDRKDIIFMSNFIYSYNGVTSRHVPDNLYCDFYKQGTKENVLVYMFENDLIEDDVYWLHDLDAFQSGNLDIDMGDADMALSDYGRMTRWNTGSVFFKKSAKDIIIAWHYVMTYFKTGDEEALEALTSKGSQDVLARRSFPKEAIGNIPILEGIEKRVKRLNISYNFTHFNVRNNYKQAIKPIKVVHFHPIDGHPIFSGNLFDFYYGRNKINTRLMSETLIKSFHYHRITQS